MRPIKITITAFIPFASKQEIDFTKFKNEGLFLINGPTGSGKTSILDAMTFALYGTLPGMRGAKTLRDGFHVKSDFAAPETAPEVIYEVEINGIEYKYTRKAEFQNPQNTTPTKGRALLEWKQNGKWEPISSNVAEINSKSLEYLGLEVNQFAQLILLPQGEFAKFFQSNSEDRKKILTKLFSVDHFESIQTWFKDQRTFADIEKTKASDEVHDLETRLKQITKKTEIEISTAAIDEFIAETQKAIDLVEPQKVQLEEEKNKIQAQLTLAKSGNEALDKFSEAKTAKENAQADKDKILLEVKNNGIELPVGQEKEVLEDNLGRLEATMTQVSEKLAVFTEIEKLAQSINSNETETQAFEEAFKSVTERFQSLNDQIDLARLNINTTQVNEAKLPGLEQELKMYIGALNDFEKLDSKILEFEEQGKQIQTALEDFEKQKCLYDQIETEYRNNIAAYLSASLKTNEPCGVCGSKDHPAPATPSEHQPTQEALDKAKHNREIAEQVHNTAVSNQSSLNVEIENLKNSIKQFDHMDLASKIEQLEDEIKEIRAEIANLEIWNASITSLSESLAKTSTDKDDCAKELAKSQERGLGLNKDLKNRLDQVSNLEETELRKKFDSFSDEREKVAVWKEKLEAISKAISGSKAIMDANEKMSENAVENLSKIQKEYETKNSEFLEVAAQLTLLTQSKKDAQDVASEFVPAAEKFADAVETALKWKNVEAYISGSEGKKLDLVSFYLGYRLKQVLAAATHRLLKATDGRYRFEHDENAAGARGTKSGLAILVNDAHTGARRGPESLSGGETFIASLSLALGLADVVIAESGGKRLDSLFVDEGFGSLDTKTLDNVMDILENLRENGRMIGVVSHVESMKERIIPQINVNKTDKGSEISISGV